MDTENRIAALVSLGECLQTYPDDLSEVVTRMGHVNGWFTETECKRMLSSICGEFLQRDLLHTWMSNYQATETQKTIGIVMAGNVPFVGMHDLLCIIMSGHKAQVKMSSKDNLFFPWMKEALSKISPPVSEQITFTEKLENFDAVIATGSNNSARYFEYYFGKYPHIIRKNRTSIAILTGNESDDALYNLGKDVFWYYGLGCRNVGKVFIPEGYDKQHFFRLWEDYRYVVDNTKYKHNYDYNRALHLLNKTNYLTNDFYMLVDSDQLYSPLSVLYAETYLHDADLQLKLESIGENLQCVVSSAPGNTPFGKTQEPRLSDYADHVDTMQFLMQV
ncbi:MAG TPA: acyl-CoA reductase [Chitinophagales bacterium]|nr:acyl-CoA reductase [Chitinophagales bacterium]